MTATTGTNTIKQLAKPSRPTKRNECHQCNNRQQHHRGNGASQSNTLSVTGVNGGKNLTANDMTGTNNIEAHTNNIGVATANSINTIGNTGTASTFTARGGNATLSVTNNAASLGVTGGGSVSADAFSATLSGTGQLTQTARLVSSRVSRGQSRSITRPRPSAKTPPSTTRWAVLPTRTS